MPSTEELLGQDRGMLCDIEPVERLSEALSAAMALPQSARLAMGVRASRWVISRYSRAERLGQLLAALDIRAIEGTAAECRPRRLEFPCE